MYHNVFPEMIVNMNETEAYIKANPNCTVHPTEARTLSVRSFG